MPPVGIISSEDLVSVEKYSITEPQFSEFQQHYENVLKDMDLNNRLNEVAEEFSNLLKLFQTCYAESERKTLKIRELTALKALEVQKEKSVTSVADENLKSMKDVITKLQKELDIMAKQRQELVKEVEGLKKTSDTEEKATQSNMERLQQPLVCTRCFNDTKLSPTDTLKEVGHALAKREIAEKDENSLLRANLDVLVADLKLTRNKISDLKKQVMNKDNIVKKYSRQIFESETKLTKVQHAVSELRKPMEITVKTYKRELELCKRKFHEMQTQLQKTININNRLSKDILSKDSEIETLTARLKETYLEKSSAIRKAELFEENLAASQVHNEHLTCEIKTLLKEIKNLKRGTDMKEAGDSVPVDDRDTERKASPENTVEHFKSQIALRDKKLATVAGELCGTVELLKKIRNDFNDTHERKAMLEEEVKTLKRAVRDKNCDLNELKAKLHGARQEVEDLKRDLQTQVIKNHQLAEKKNKIQSLYVHMKQVNNQQKNEHGILLKRQEYMVKILGSKDKELKKLLNSKRCAN